MTYNIDPHISGDTWDGIPSISFSRNNSAIDLSNAYVEMGVKYDIASPSLLTLTTINSGIRILNPAEAGYISIPEILIEIPPGNYKWYIKLILSSGETKTYIMGTWVISANIPK